MPVIKSEYTAPFGFGNRHVQTVFPTLFRRVKHIDFTRYRHETTDGDFFDADCAFGNGDRVIILVHGLEGNSRRKYMCGMARAFAKKGFDVVSLNLRGCSGERNRLPRMYHSGDTADLSATISWVKGFSRYKSCHLAGFSLGGNIVLKYMGEAGGGIDPFVKSAVAVSAPCDLRSCSIEMEKPCNAIYMKNFLHTLIQKVREKEKIYPDIISAHGAGRIKTFREFDDRYTSKLHGFVDAEDYWSRASSVGQLVRISAPTLILNAVDDPILGEGCYPYDAAEKNRFLYLETPSNGGHVGFISRGSEFYWHERRAVEFVTSHL